MRYVVFILLLSVGYTVLGQKMIRLENNQSQKVKWIEEGRTVKVKYKEEVIRGEYQNVNDTVILIDTNRVTLSEVEWILAKTDASKVAGALLIVVGTGFNVLGAIVIASPKDHWMEYLIYNTLGAVSLGTGTVMTLNGVLFYAVGYKHYSSKWKVSIDSPVE